MMETRQSPDTDVARTLGAGEHASTGKPMKKRVAWGITAAVLVVAIIAWLSGRDGESYVYKTQESKRGDLVVSVSATGNLQPTNQVDVGSELSGIVRRVEADYNDHVKVGQVLARLDTDKLQAKVQQSRATLMAARSRVIQARATVSESRSTLERLSRLRKLSDGRVPSENDMETAQAALDRALADLASAEAQVSQAEATLSADETDLGKAVITSPINGIVLARSIEPGQTVAASLQAPVLFTLAEDLAKMELHVDVDEADVGEVRQDQEATFTVDAYPDRKFPATVRQVRYGSQTSGGVVTYKAVLGLDNSDLLLRPGMTATADIVVRKVTDALLVPNAALRFSPPNDGRDSKESASDTSMISKLFPRPPRGSARTRRDTTDPRIQTVWVQRDKGLASIQIVTGATDGTMTEVVSGDLAPGTALVVDAASRKK